MIPRSHRFHGLNSLRHVYARGQTSRGPLLAIKYIFNNRRQSYRVAVVVSRKVHKSAVVRNRIRRRVYEWVRLRQNDIIQPYDIVITIFSEGVATMDAKALDAMLYEQFARGGLFEPPEVDQQGDKVAGRAIVEQIARTEPKEKS